MKIFKILDSIKGPVYNYEPVNYVTNIFACSFTWLTPLTWLSTRVPTRFATLLPENVLPNDYLPDFFGNKNKEPMMEMKKKLLMTGKYNMRFLLDSCEIIMYKYSVRTLISRKTVLLLIFWCHFKDLSTDFVLQLSSNVGSQIFEWFVFEPESFFQR